MVNPTEEITNVKGSFCTVVNLNAPLSSEKVPVVPPLTVTETAETASLDLAFFTLPETVVDVWARVLSVKPKPKITST